MNRVALWVMSAAGAWLAAKSIRAGAVHAAPARHASVRTDNKKSMVGRKAEPQHETGAIVHERHDHGRMANKPSEIPPRGWKDILLRTYRSISEDRVFALAAGVTYYVLLALFPGIAALVSIYGLIADPGIIAEDIAALSNVVPAAAIDIIRGQLQHLAAQDQQTLGFAFIAGLLASIWGANAAIKGLFDALNVVYGEREKRNFFILNVMSLGFTAGFVLFLALAMIGIVVVPAVLDLFHLGGATEIITNLLRWPAMLAILVMALAVVYRYGPSRADARWRWISWGSVAAAILWLIVSMLFSWYASNFGNYDKTYGSLGAVAAFMVWTWLSMSIVLLGGELNAEIEHQTAKDSTTGAPKPLGERGARMADTVGAAQD